MNCFSMQKLKKRYNGAEQAGSLEGNASADSDQESSPPMASTFSSARMSFRSRVRAIQNAQRFINSNPKLRSSHPSYGSRESKKGGPEASSPLLPLGGRVRSVTDLGSALFDVATACRPRPTRHLDSAAKNLPSVAAAHLHPLVGDACTNLPFLQPLPSPPQVLHSLQKVSQSSSVYRLPLPSENAHNTPCPVLPPPRSSRSSAIDATCMHTSMPLPLASKQSKSSLRAVSSTSSATACDQMQIGSNSILLVQTHQPQNDSDVVSSSIPSQDVIMHANCRASELQPLAAWPLRCFKYNELSSACQNFGLDCRIAEADVCFNGTVKVKGNWKAGKHQDVVVLVLKEPQQQASELCGANIERGCHDTRAWFEPKQLQGLQKWMLKLSMVAHELHHPLHVCQLIGFYGEDGCAERMLVYERLKKGTLFSLLFEASDIPPLEWSLRMKIAYGAAEGLARLHEVFPDIVLYRDFRASSIQVDNDYSSKVSLYRFLNPIDSEIQTSPSNPRVTAYRAPETVSRGELTLKSNVWSFGVILLELLSGKQHLNEETTKNERLNLVKWAKPFLVDEGKLFLLMDPKLQGKFPSRGAKMVAHLALACLQKDPTKRPSMRETLDIVRDVHHSRCSAREPIVIHKASSSSSSALPMSGSSPVKPGLINLSHDDKTSSKFDVVENPPLRRLIIPPRYCGEGIVHHQHDCSLPLWHM